MDQCLHVTLIFGYLNFMDVSSNMMSPIVQQELHEIQNRNLMFV